MKKLTSLWMMILMLSVSIPAMGSMSISKMRENARFLTDKMAYELNLSMMQYDDVYEVNYDFINSVRYIMDDVVRGYDHAVDRYYDYLDYRNEDLRWILTETQYRRFMNVDYFYRPIYTTQDNWLFRIYKVYRDVKLFYFDKPHHYKSYNGAHSRLNHHAGYYKDHHQSRYQHEYYKGDVKLRKEKPAPKMEEKRRPAKANGQKPSVKNEKRENTQKRFNNSRGNDNGRENGRRAARSR